MKTTETTFLKQANFAFRKKDYKSAVALYEQAIDNAHIILQEKIKFNLELAKRLAEISKQGSAEAKENKEESSIKSNPIFERDWRSFAHDIKDQFDNEFYLWKYPDIKMASIDPLEHYSITGWREGRDPRSDFSTNTYLELNEDVAAAGIDPFWHYVVAGKAEGRPREHPGGKRIEILRATSTLEDFVKQWEKKENLSPDLMNVSQVVELLNSRISSRIHSLAISVGHDHYLRVSGGIQLCIQREAQLARKNSILYLNVYPWQPLPVLASISENPDPIVSLILEDKDIGNCRSSVLKYGLMQINGKLENGLKVILHSLLGHSIEQVKEWVMLSESRKCFFWLHDFFALCPSYTLQRNNISFCEAPAQQSNACNICIYGEERVLHSKRIENFFQNLSVTVISPSEITKEFWLRKAEHLSPEIEVSPHMILPWIDREKIVKKNENPSISIGYLGGTVYHKGWHVFEKLIQNFENDDRFRFVYFGKNNPKINGLKNVDVHVTSANYFAMSQAISAEEIDYVLHWATWPETFSFTTYEAIAGGAYVITNSGSGNVAATVMSTGKGVVLPNLDSLIEFFKEGEATELVKTIRENNAAHICQPCFSDMTLPFIMN